MTILNMIKSLLHPYRTASATRLSAFPVPQLDPEVATNLRQMLEENSFAVHPSSESSQDNAHQNILYELFSRGEPVNTNQVKAILQPQLLAELVRTGLLQKTNCKVWSLFQIQRYKGLIFVADFFRDSQRSDFVLQVGPAGKYLADLTIRKPVTSALDIGCGCGIQSLLAAKHCKLVTATDINPRALALTRLNANINGIMNLEILEGSFFEPVKERSFDLIVANLPYVITPENKYIYRDSGAALDTNLYRLLREIPTYLNEFGFAQVLANWIHPPQQPYWQPLRTSLQGLPVDAWLIHNGSKKPDEYAEMWLDIPKTEQKAYERKKKDWLAWYQSQHIELIALGAITLRRRNAGENWVCSATVIKSLTAPAGNQIFYLFQAQDEITLLENQHDLDNARLVALQATVEAVPLTSDVLVCCASGMLLSAKVQATTLEVLKFLDGRNTLVEAIQLSKVTQGNIHADIRLLINLGMLRKAD